ncbi:lysylphosphatidylglycerol synthase transmembrane domain-containing protein [Paludicola sp. MB14-C6]|uniref:lysylphosphatidylglycerol synthase transmembrane domain-containing protein n=1 Tax=Paludihabitans sp. MB14-C6 TaxID=3070656 RepID=UPI0027DD506D|nr:lysylphosphatidylglycerol synthase transmembrane domain-containing protein [Paludicola sp. MB14-C6]WMJ22844.1 lysylphosphatidylglycerol synthase transmembrane domain-containing protein [Paludicola sp. MB14-C6]
MKKNKENNNHHIGSLIFMLVLIGLTFYLLFKDNSLASLLPYIKKANPFYLILGLFTMIGYIACEAINIKIITKSLNIKVPFWRCMEYSFIGFYFCSITPSASGGQPAQIYYMKRDNINISYSTLTILIITVAYQIVMLLYGLLMYIVEFNFVSTNIKGIKWLILFGVVINVILVAIIIFSIFSKKVITKCVLAITNFLAKIKLMKHVDSTQKNIMHQLDEYTEGAKYVKQNPMLFVKVSFFTFLQKTALYSVPFFVYKAFNLTGHTFLEMVALQALFTIAVASLPLPGAVGVTEASFLTVFKIFFSSGLILPAMLLSRGISFYAILIISAIITIIVHMRKRPIINDKLKKAA